MPLNRQKAVREAEQLASRGRYDAAIEAYQAVLKDNPRDTTTLNRLGDLFARLQRMDEAIDLFQRTAAHFTDEGFFVKAIAIYKKIIRLDPARIEIYKSLADLYHRQGLATEARVQFQVVADYYLKHENLPAAIEVIERMVEAEPKNPSHRLRLAELLEQTERSGEAMNQYLGIAEIMLEHGRVDEATRVCVSALDVDAGNTEFIAEVTGRLRQSGDPQAEKTFLEAVQKRTGSTEVPVLSAEEEVLADADVPVEEIAEVEEVEEVGPGDPPADVGVVQEVEDGQAWLAKVGPLEEPVEESLEEQIILEADEVDVARDVLAEASVLVSYGLERKAIERLAELLDEDEKCPEIWDRLVRLQIEHADPEMTAQSATRMASVTMEAGREDLWDALKVDLLESGFGIEGLQVASPESEIEAPVVKAEVEPEEEVLPPVVLDLPLSEETQVLWLGEETAEQELPTEQADQQLFAAEEEFFDLAAELEEELAREETLQQAGEAIADEIHDVHEDQSLEEIVEGFRKGVAEVLLPEDYDTHYNLGIAYREMGLVDEAIGEFQLAAKDPRYLVDCCSLLAASFLDKGFPELAIRWYMRALDSPAISEDESLGLLYELGNLYLATGDKSAAQRHFVEIYGVNSNYRDVVAKLEELRQSSSK